MQVDIGTNVFLKPTLYLNKITGPFHRCLSLFATFLRKCIEEKRENQNLPLLANFVIF